LTTVPAAAPVASEAPNVLVRLEGVEQFYGEKIRILGPIDLEVREGEFLSLVGPSGCGKSTILRIVTGVLRPSAGTVRVGGRALKGVNTRTAMVFQSFALFPWLAVIDNAQKNLSDLSTQVTSLRDVLANKQSRGAFGQARMEAIVQDGLTKGAYEFQYTLSNRTRPDCVVFLPDKRPLVIDAKFPLEAEISQVPPP